MLRDLLDGLLALLYPAICIACGRSLAPPQRHFCASCREQLTTDPHAICPRCAGTVGPHIVLDNGCPLCRTDVFHFESVVRLSSYDGLLRELILRLKHVTGEGLAELLGELWAEHAEARLRATGAEAIVPMPLHWRRRWSRGYNQCESLAGGLADRLGLPCRPRWLRRNRYTPYQTAQTPAERRHNVRGAFIAQRRPELRGRTILLVDDVLTTGSTASEAARALKDAGAARVVVAVLARGTG